MAKFDTFEAYQADKSKWEKELAQLRSILLSFDLKECIKWNTPVYTYQGQNLIGLGAFKNDVCIWFFHGALLSDSENLLTNAQGDKTKAMRQLRFNSQSVIPEDSIRIFIAETIQDHLDGKKIVYNKPSPFVLHPLLEKTFQKNPNLETAFNTITPYKQKEFCAHLAAAKKEETQLKRLDKIIPLILAGKGINDKYRY
ncbi:YdeI family protein [Ancylomarina sp.]|uniref:YdeI/OmpD-associated family protein n=1 Tax=Ancylomarina sp. TaxID=1970196 RepID=UPI003567C662